MKAQCIIASHEESTIKKLYTYLRYDGDIEIVAICRDAVETIKNIDSLKPELILLDLQMSEANGFEILNSLEYVPNGIVFLTDDDPTEIKVLRKCAMTYLLKSYKEDDLSQVLDNFKNGITSSNPTNDFQFTLQEIIKNQKVQNGLLSSDEKDRLICKVDGKVHFINFLDIIWVEAYEYYLKIHFENNFYLVRGNLENIAMKSKEHFIQISESVIVNANYIMFVDRHVKNGEVQVVLQDGTPLLISQKFESEVIQRIS